MTMEENHELRIAWDFVENTGRSIFLTGKAGTGKTTFLKTVVEKSRKRPIVVAPTGVADAAAFKKLLTGIIFLSADE